MLIGLFGAGAVSAQDTLQDSLQTSLQNENAPDGPKTVHRLEGLVIDHGSQQSIPFATILIRNTAQGTVADGRGYFSLVVQSRDTIAVTAVGYKGGTYVVPDTLGEIYIRTGFALTPDTILLDPVEVYPWPHQRSFKREFVELEQVTPEDLVSQDAGFIRLDNPIEPEASIMSPASFFYEKVVVAIKKKKRKRKKSKQLPKMN